MNETEFSIKQAAEWNDAEKKKPDGRQKVLVCYLDSITQSPVTTTAYYIARRTVMRGTPGVNSELEYCVEHDRKLWVRSGWFEPSAHSSDRCLNVKVIAWQPLPRYAVWMVTKSMQMQQELNPIPAMQS